MNMIESSGTRVATLKAMFFLPESDFRFAPNSEGYCSVGSFCLNISIMTMHVQKEGISKVWVPSLQEANSPQGN